MNHVGVVAHTLFPYVSICWCRRHGHIVIPPTDQHRGEVLDEFCCKEHGIKSVLHACERQMLKDMDASVLMCRVNASVLPETPFECDPVMLYNAACINDMFDNFNSAYHGVWAGESRHDMIHLPLPNKASERLIIRATDHVLIHLH